MTCESLLLQGSCGVPAATTAVPTATGVPSTVGYSVLFGWVRCGNGSFPKKGDPNIEPKIL